MTLEGEIQDSLNRLQDAFHEHYGNYPLLEGRSTVGMLTFNRKNHTVYVTYRGSVNSFLEPLSCLCFWKKSLQEANENFQFKGMVHAALLNSFQKVKKCFDRQLDTIVQETKTSPKDWKFVVEGYSRGSALAMLTALFLKQTSFQNSVRVFTYSTMKIFDREGAKSFEKVIGNEHLSFVCEEDPFPHYLGPSVFGFHSTPKKPIFFKATGTSDYDERVKQKRYSYLHMPPRYNKIAPSSC